MLGIYPRSASCALGISSLCLHNGQALGLSVRGLHIYARHGQLIFLNVLLLSIPLMASPALDYGSRSTHIASSTTMWPTGKVESNRASMASQHPRPSHRKRV